MMNRVLWALVGGSMLLGCSTALPPPVALENPPPLSDPLLAQACKLGTSCMDLDPRPFETCLVGTGKRCLDKATEPLLVIDPQPAHPAEPLQIRSE